MFSLVLAFCQACSHSTVIVPEAEEEELAGYLYEERLTMRSVDGREIIALVDRPRGVSVPILLMVDGSGCTGQLRPGFRELFQPGPTSLRPYARIRVEKPGVDHGAQPGDECSEEFFRNYSMHDRVADHLRVLQHLEARAEWWDSELYVWGWSDGGDIATRITAYYPKVTRAVLGAMGGGYSMADHFRDFWVCDREAGKRGNEECVSELNEQFEKIRGNPTWTKTWSGNDNSWKAWASRLDAKLTNLLIDNKTPVLIIQGAEDFDATPAKSARKLVAELNAAGNDSFIYWEVEGMGHGWGGLPPETAERVETDMLIWLLTEK